MSDMLEAAFQRLSAAPDNQQWFPPRPFQMAVTEALLGGSRVVLRTPAASGKSLAGWLPWLAARLSSYDFPPQLLHVLPDHVMFSELHDTLETLTRTIKGLRVSTQTETESFDPFFLGDATFTTVEQLLSAALQCPLGIHPNLANINAGAMFGAYLLFDEFPALARPEALTMWLGLLRRYYPLTPCLFNTTSLPRPLCRHIADALGAELLEFPELAGGGRRTWFQLPALSADALLRQHHQRTMVVCNTIRGAQTLYRQLQRLFAHDAHAPELLLLHPYLFSRDQQRAERRAAELFRHSAHANAWLITTSCIETGSEFSADTLITEPAPTEQLLRRAGRCARFEGEDGRMIVAPVSEQFSEEGFLGPDWRAMVTGLADGAAKTFAEELAIYDATWAGAPAEAVPEIIRQFPALPDIDARPAQAMTTGGTEALFTHLGVALHRIPEVVQDPFELERLSVTRGSLERGLLRWQASGGADEWFALTPRWTASAPSSPHWNFVEATGEVRGAARLIIINADAVSYHPEIGLEFAPGHPYQSEQIPRQKTSIAPIDQHVETFEEHALRALNALEHETAWYHYVLRRLGGCWRMPQSELDRWLRLVVLWHDAGKLSAEWQRAAVRWQAEGVRRPIAGAVLGRLDYQAQRDGDFPCPPHAQVSGLALTRAFARLLGSHSALYQGTIAALGAHHGGAPSPDIDLTPHPEAWGTLMELAGKIIDEQQLRGLFRTGWNMHPNGLPAVSLTMPTDPEAWMAYTLLVRAIRLADREVSLAEMLKA